MIPAIDLKRTGKRLKTIMEIRGIDAEDIRRFLSLASVQSVYYWISGRNMPTIDNLYALSKFLKVPLGFLVVGTKPDEREKSIDGFLRGMYYSETLERLIFAA